MKKKTRKMQSGGVTPKDLSKDRSIQELLDREMTAADRARRRLDIYDEDNYRRGLERTLSENVGRHAGPGIGNAISRAIARGANAASRVGANLTSGERAAKRARFRAEIEDAERAMMDTLGRKKGGPIKGRKKSGPVKVMKKGGPVKGMKKGGNFRGDGICQRGKTRGRIV